MNTPFKILAVVGGLFGIGVVGAFYMFFSSFSGMCGNSIARTIESTTRQWKIVVFERDCGATSGFSTQISILRIDQDLPDESGNIFSADGGHGDAEIDEMGLIYVEPTWLDSKTILVKYDRLATVYEQEADFDGLTIRYERVEKAHNTTVP